MTPADLSPLAAPVNGELYEMTFPAYHHLLELRPAARHPNLGEERAVQAFGWVARQQGRPVGLALAEAPLPGDAAEPQLLSLFVRPEARQQGIATALVAAVETTARELGHRRLGAVYTSGKPAIGWMERIFAARGWDPPRPGSLVATFAPQDALDSERYRPTLLRGYQRGLEIFPWSELRPGELDEIKKSDEEQHWIAPQLNPWQYDARHLDASSVGARWEGQVVGWVLNHRVSKDQVRWSISYMHPALSRRGKVVALYHASLSRLVEEGSCRLCTFTTPFSYGPMAAFAERWIAPFARSLERSNLVGVSLEAKRPAAQEADALPGGGAAEPGERRLTAASERL
jgi:GNAT superfamily N-acetyltransferase